ncbi:ATP-binding protein [Flammeovirga agarivorans]|uniref:histidine kinase n=1 Tax=Flammeovirga agarivorans TaxID=2726742 RepID=A0A7X8SQN3_9BACT|nr:ATP-binding protein [Flammeovirga agarivorans]NLR94631.1 PAS domain S-box protein [Flammeovirga agarivorans]
MTSVNTEGFKAESYYQMLEEKDKILSLIYDTVGDVIFALNVNSTGEYIFSSVNQSFLNATGLNRDQVIGKNVKEVIPEPSLSLVLGHYETAIRTKSSVSWEEITPYPTGRKIGEVRIAPIFDQNDRCKMLIGSVHDITESRNYAKKLEDSMEKVAQKNYELEQMGYVTSHDLREPLNTIQSFSMLLKEELSELDNIGNSEKYLEFINSATGRMQVLLKGMLDYNVIGKQLQLKRSDLNAVVDVVLADLAGSIMKVEAEVIVPELPTLNVYETELRLLFQNLISNSIKYRQPDVPIKIEITSEQLDEKWKIEVIDNGIGIEEEYFERVFHVFQRLHKKNEFEGAGIGLSICKKVIDLHDGQIWVEKNQPQGSKFCFTISNELV